MRYNTTFASLVTAIVACFCLNYLQKQLIFNILFFHF
ncbi:MAG: hypothetical protein RL181_220 [Bacteroidota bacterium]